MVIGPSYLRSLGRPWKHPPVGKLHVRVNRRFTATVGRYVGSRDLIEVSPTVVGFSAKLQRKILCHEAAHLVVWKRYGKSVRPHGPEWRALVQEAGFDALILSPRTAGIGLTITEANHVIHLSRWWNPAVEDQATDRVYRIGQKRPVHVHTPLAVHPRLGDASFDVQLHDLLSKKRDLSRDVLAPPQMSDAELSSLYRGAMQ